MGLSLFFGKTFGFSFVVLVTVIFLHTLGFSSSIVFCARISSFAVVFSLLRFFVTAIFSHVHQLSSFMVLLCKDFKIVFFVVKITYE